MTHPASAPTSEAGSVLAWLEAVCQPRAHDLQSDSRAVAAGDVFVALPGARADGRAYIDAAVARGAAAVLVESEGWIARDVGVPVRPVSNLRAGLGPLAAAFYGQPSAPLLSIGVTGTNGKTSTSQWIAQILSRTGTRCAVIGTIGTGFPGEALADTGLTTPDAIGLQREVKRLRDAGARALAMEVSSIGLDQFRVDGMKFDLALFTNLTRDHLDYHRSMAGYEAAKARLFEWPGLTGAVLNLDDAAGRRFARRCVERGLRTIGYSIAAAPPSVPQVELLHAQSIRSTAHGLAFDVVAGSARHAVDVPLAGTFNVSNLLGVLGVLIATGVPLARACAELPHLEPPPGRMQRIGSGIGEPLAIVDYAHTPDALEQALIALRPQAAARGGALWVVFGAGGDRDPGKRAPMGAAAARLADRVVVTSDNPRTEDPAAIVDQVSGGAHGAQGAAAVERVVDRADAIAHALLSAAEQDIVLIAGKGHEDYQDIGGHKRPFSDVEQARLALARRRGPA
jgi:UDP-N-acetylmuramoyl-L-alanyl-D-glutamate--2,6-diaminopimelate ligase